MTVFDQVLQRSEFKERPPVLLDLGASGYIHKRWRPIAHHCVCVAFDADEREMGYVTKAQSGYRELHLCKAAVTDRTDEKIPFHLTAFPFCSSTLVPDKNSLTEWVFGPSFEVQRTVELPATTLPKVLSDLKLPGVDWFKCDTQGTDLRLFKSLGEQTLSNVLAVEFEPGFIDVYQNEDKLFHVLQFMQDRPFYLADLNVMRISRIRQEHLQRLGGLERRILSHALSPAPGWGEMTFLNTLQSGENLGIREWLLAWVFATMLDQHGFALDLADRGHKRFGDSIFLSLTEYTMKRLHRNAMWVLPGLAVNRVFARIGKLFSKGD